MDGSFNRFQTLKVIAEFSILRYNASMNQDHKYGI